MDAILNCIVTVVGKTVQLDIIAEGVRNATIEAYNNVLQQTNAG